MARGARDLQDTLAAYTTVPFQTRGITLPWGEVGGWVGGRAGPGTCAAMVQSRVQPGAHQSTCFLC